MNYSKYLVTQGDTLYKIANKFGVSVNDLISANNLKSNVIYPNQVLLIPSSTLSNEIIVGYNTTVREFLEKNDLDLDDIYDLKLMPEQVIVKQSKIFRVTNNITIDEILRRNNISSEELLRLNQNRWFKNGNEIIIG